MTVAIATTAQAVKSAITNVVAKVMAAPSQCYDNNSSVYSWVKDAAFFTDAAISYLKFIRLK
jgi:hypothetical protein